jgi:luciferase family oxidoreductase group 1
VQGKPLKLSILDQLPIREGGHPQDPINEAITLAKRAEAWGYHRYWTAQFHNTVSFTTAAPELVACRLAAETKTLRVGAGGILLSNVSPYIVAEQFNMLETFFPGRIDLGIGRTPGGDAATHAACLYGSPLGQNAFEQKMIDLKAFVAGLPPLNPQWQHIKATPVTDHHPQLWSLGSGEGSATLAAKHGFALSFAHFINPYSYADVIAAYRQHFQPSVFSPQPVANVCVYAICCDTEAEAIRQRASRDLWWAEVFQGQDPPYRSVEKGLAYPYTVAQTEQLRVKREAVIVGTPEQVKAQIEAIAAKAQVDEVMIQTMCFDFAVRLRSFELIAEVFGD